MVLLIKVKSGRVQIWLNYETARNANAVAVASVKENARNASVNA